MRRLIIAGLLVATSAQQPLSNSFQQVFEACQPHLSTCGVQAPQPNSLELPKVEEVANCFQSIDWAPNDPCHQQWQNFENEAIATAENACSCTTANSLAMPERVSSLKQCAEANNSNAQCQNYNNIVQMMGQDQGSQDAQTQANQDALTAFQSIFQNCSSELQGCNIQTPDWSTMQTQIPGAIITQVQNCFQPLMPTWQAGHPCMTSWNGFVPYLSASQAATQTTTQTTAVTQPAQQPAKKKAAATTVTTTTTTTPGAQADAQSQPQASEQIPQVGLNLLNTCQSNINEFCDVTAEQLQNMQANPQGESVTLFHTTETCLRNHWRAGSLSGECNELFGRWDVLRACHQPISSSCANTSARRRLLQLVSNGNSASPFAWLSNFPAERYMTSAWDNTWQCLGNNKANLAGECSETIGTLEQLVAQAGQAAQQTAEQAGQAAQQAGQEAQQATQQAGEQAQQAADQAQQAANQAQQQAQQTAEQAAQQAQQAAQQAGQETQNAAQQAADQARQAADQAQQAANQTQQQAQQTAEQASQEAQQAAQQAGQQAQDASQQAADQAQQAAGQAQQSADQAAQQVQQAADQASQQAQEAAQAVGQQVQQSTQDAVQAAQQAAQQAQQAAQQTQQQAQQAAEQGQQAAQQAGQEAQNTAQQAAQQAQQAAQQAQQAAQQTQQQVQQAAGQAAGQAQQQAQQGAQEAAQPLAFFLRRADGNCLGHQGQLHPCGRDAQKWNIMESDQGYNLVDADGQCLNSKPENGEFVGDCNGQDMSLDLLPLALSNPNGWDGIIISDGEKCLNAGENVEFGDCSATASAWIMQPAFEQSGDSAPMQIPGLIFADGKYYVLSSQYGSGMNGPQMNAPQMNTQMMNMPQMMNAPVLGNYYFQGMPAMSNPTFFTAPLPTAFGSSSLSRSSPSTTTTSSTSTLLPRASTSTSTTSALPRGSASTGSFQSAASNSRPLTYQQAVNLGLFPAASPQRIILG